MKRTQKPTLPSGSDLPSQPTTTTDLPALSKSIDSDFSSPNVPTELEISVPWGKKKATAKGHENRIADKLGSPLPNDMRVSTTYGRPGCTKADFVQAFYEFTRAEHSAKLKIGQIVDSGEVGSPVRFDSSAKKVITKGNSPLSRMNETPVATPPATQLPTDTEASPAHDSFAKVVQAVKQSVTQAIQYELDGDLVEVRIVKKGRKAGVQPVRAVGSAEKLEIVGKLLELRRTKVLLPYAPERGRSARPPGEWIQSSLQSILPQPVIDLLKVEPALWRQVDEKVYTNLKTRKQRSK